MAKRVYIETTVVSYYVARPNRNVIIAGHQEATRKLWPRLSMLYDTYVSALVFEESRKGDPGRAKRRVDAIAPFRMLDVDDHAYHLASKIIENGGVPKEYPEDALHIAVAAMNGMDVLITWNFAHLNNPFTRLKVRRAVESEGFLCPEICSPEELLETDQ